MQHVAIVHASPQTLFACVDVTATLSRPASLQTCVVSRCTKARTAPKPQNLHSFKANNHCKFCAAPTGSAGRCCHARAGRPTRQQQRSARSRLRSAPGTRCRTRRHTWCRSERSGPPSRPLPRPPAPARQRARLPRTLAARGRLAHAPAWQTPQRHAQCANSSEGVLSAGYQPMRIRTPTAPR